MCGATPLRFADGAPVRAASGIAPYDGGWLVVQDDATHACLWREGVGRPVRLFPPVGGREVFDEGSGTKGLKPDVEAALALPDGRALVLGSGSTDARMRSALLAPGAPPVVTELGPLYARVARALDVPPDRLNLEGACLVGENLRWFQRGLPSAGVPTGSVDLPLEWLLTDPNSAEPTAARHYDLGSVSGVGLAVTDALALSDRLVLVSAAAEDSRSTYDDGPVVGSALALLEDDRLADLEELPLLDGAVPKVEGLALAADADETLDLVAVVDADDPGVPSLLLELQVTHFLR
jgi:hypothetical protein